MKVAHKDILSRRLHSGVLQLEFETAALTAFFHSAQSAVLRSSLDLDEVPGGASLAGAACGVCALWRLR